MVHQAVILSALGLAGNAMSAPAAMRAENHARRVLTDDSVVQPPPMGPGPVVPQDIPLDIPADDLEARKAGGAITEGIKALVNGIGIGGGTVGSNDVLGNEEKRAVENYIQELSTRSEKRAALDLQRRKGKLGETILELGKGLATGIGIGGGTAGTEEALDDGSAAKRAINAEKRAIEELERRKGKLGETLVELGKGLATGIGIGGGTAGTEEALDDGSAAKRAIDLERRKGKLGETIVELGKGLATGIGIGGGTAGTEEALDDGSAAKRELMEMERRKGKIGETLVELGKGLATGIGIGGGTAGTEEALDDGSAKRGIDAEKRALEDLERRKGKIGETLVELGKGLATGIGIGGGTAGTEEALDDGSAEKRALMDLQRRKGKLGETILELGKGLATGIGIGGGTAGTEEALEDPAASPEAKRMVIPPGDVYPPGPIPTPPYPMDDLYTTTIADDDTAVTEKLKRAVEDYLEVEKRKGGGGKKDDKEGGGIISELGKGLAAGLGIGSGTVGTEEGIDAVASPEAKRIVMPPPGGPLYPPGPIPTPGNPMDDNLYTTLDTSLGENE